MTNISPIKLTVAQVIAQTISALMERISCVVTQLFRQMIASTSCLFFKLIQSAVAVCVCMGLLGYNDQEESQRGPGDQEAMRK